MLAQPDGLKYWIDTPYGVKIADDAPEWAKKEFAEYQKEMQPNYEDGIIKNK